MHIFYITNARIPTRKAYGIQIIQFLHALQEKGVVVALRVPYRKGTKKISPTAFYGIPGEIQTTYSGFFDPFALDSVLGNRIAFHLSRAVFLLSIWRHLPEKGTVIITRDSEIAWLLSRSGYRTYYHAHNFPTRYKSHVRQLAHASGIIANSVGTAEEYRERLRIPVAVIPNGVDPSRFAIDCSQDDLRDELGLPKQASIVMYTGHLYAWKGVETLYEAARKLPDIHFVFIGGLDEDIERYRSRVSAEGLKNVHILGYKPASLIPRYLSAADVLVLPNSGTSKESEKYTSPLKLFEYMASGVPVLASSLPAIREILPEDTAYFFEPDNAASLANKITELLSDTTEAQKRARGARALVSERYTWSAAAERLLEFIS